jgi:hypothetical protein
LLLTLLGLASATPAQAVTPLRSIVEDVPGATAYRYGLRDNVGNAMETLKVVKSPLGGYVGVYHTTSSGRGVVKVATSVDLMNWQFAGNLSANASQPTIYMLSHGASVVAFERELGCAGGGNCLVLRYYSTESALLNGSATRSAVLPRSLSNCAEGTPNIFAAKDDLSSIDIGFHYFSDCYVDRQGRGTLTNFDAATWSPRATWNIDADVLGAGVSADANIGDRDGNFYDGAYQRLIEGQLTRGDFGSWRNFLWVGGVATQLAIRTHGGSQSFANPTFTPLTLPSGQPGVVVTQYIPLSGAAAGEAGELIYYQSQEKVATIAAAGDISCAQNTTCHDDETSNLLMNDRPQRVLALGDIQYEAGELANYQTYFEPDWGRFKDIIMPTPGNHDPPSSGYTAYFGVPANYSYDLGAWHLISLDSTNVTAATPFLDSDLAQHPNSCILAYWHHPRFSSGSTHGNSAVPAPFWTRLYAAGADVVLNGHSHIYERFAPQTPSAVASPTGIREFVVGTGGKALHSVGTVKVNSEVRLAGKYGVLRMTLRAGSYEWRFEGEDGVTYDSGSSPCS